MQILLTTATVAGTTPIYLPYDKAPVPFGDPLAGTVTSAAAAVFTVPGYYPTNRDAVSLSIAGGGAGNTLSTGGLATTMAQVNTTYYVASASGDTFSLTSNKASGSDYPVATLSTGGGYLLTGQLFVHLLSNQIDGTTCPFKTGATAVAWNAGNAGTSVSTAANAFAAITILGAPDLNTVLATGTYGAPLGPNALGTTGWNVIGTIGFGTPKLVTLNYDWIVASGSTSSLVLIQN